MRRATILPMMTMKSRNEYLETLIRSRGYLTKSKKERSLLLDEYCNNTKQNRKYISRKIRTGKWVKHPTKTKTRKRKEYYDGDVKVNLVKIWKMFDLPCGARLRAILQTEVARLRKLGELVCSNEIASKLLKMSSKTIDRKLVREKELLRLKRKYEHKVHPLLYQKVPVKIFSEQNREELGNLQIDLVEHCGQSPKGEFLNTLSTTDLLSGWWMGRAIKGKSEKATLQALCQARTYFPFEWKSIHSDNGTEFINAHLYTYTQKEKIGFYRSRPFRKNDNYLVEQKNYTHVRRYLGNLRYDTQGELEILNSLYDDLYLYKNFFQPQIKLKEKVRVGSKIQRRYQRPRTPYHIVMQSKVLSSDQKQKLKTLYESLNPAALKRSIDQKLDLLYQVYQQKQNKNIVSKVEGNRKKLNLISSTF